MDIKLIIFFCMTAFLSSGFSQTLNNLQSEANLLHSDAENLLQSLRHEVSTHIVEVSDTMVFESANATFTKDDKKIAICAVYNSNWLKYELINFHEKLNELQEMSNNFKMIVLNVMSSSSVISNPDVAYAAVAAEIVAGRVALNEKEVALRTATETVKEAANNRSNDLINCLNIIDYI